MMPKAYTKVNIITVSRYCDKVVCVNILHTAISPMCYWMQVMQDTFYGLL